MDIKIVYEILTLALGFSGAWILFLVVISSVGPIPTDEEACLTFSKLSLIMLLVSIIMYYCRGIVGLS